MALSQAHIQETSENIIKNVLNV